MKGRKLTICINIYADIVGPFPVRTPEGFLYSLTLIDKFSNTTWVENFVSKGEVEEFLEFFVHMIDRKKGRVSTFQFFVSDQGGEFMSTVFKNFLRKKGIQHMVGPPNTPQYFSIVERANRTIGEMAEAMRKFAMMTDSSWGYAQKYAAYVQTGALQSPVLEILRLFKYKQRLSLISPKLKFLELFVW